MAECRGSSEALFSSDELRGGLKAVSEMVAVQRGTWIGLAGKRTPPMLVICCG